MSSNSNARTFAHLNAKIEKLKKLSHLPEALVDIVTPISLLQFECLEQVRFSQKIEQALPDELEKFFSSPESRTQGAFLLSPAHFPLDTGLAATCLPRILDVTAGISELAKPAAVLREALERKDYVVEDLCRSVLAFAAEQSASRGGTPTGTNVFADWASKQPEAPEFLHFVTHSAVMPSLAIAGRLLGEKLSGPAVWLHGHCPVCGSLPYFGRLKDAVGNRWHSCSFCNYEYRVPRIACPVCLTESHDGSIYYTSEDEPGFQLTVCDTCKNYIKLANMRESDSAYFPMLDDLESLALDINARQMGYTRPTLSAWGF